MSPAPQITNESVSRELTNSESVAQQLPFDSALLILAFCSITAGVIHDRLIRQLKSIARVDIIVFL